MHEHQQQPEEATSETTRTDEGVCPECGEKTVLQGRERLCTGCGLVLDDQSIDHGPEWRAFDARERAKKKRTGAPRTHRRHDKGLTTEISWSDKDAFGRNLSNRKRQQMSRLRKRHERSRAQGKERGVRFALGEIERMSSALGLKKSVREIASAVYQQVADRDLIRGRSLEAAATACLYIGCRQNGVPVPPDKLYSVARVGKIETDRSYRKFSRELGLSLEPIEPAQYLPRFISALDASSELEATARDIIEVTTDEGLHSGKSPSAFAASAIYAAGVMTNERYTQEQIADVCDVTTVTIRNRYQEQMQIVSEDSE